MVKSIKLFGRELVRYGEEPIPEKSKIVMPDRMQTLSSMRANADATITLEMCRKIALLEPLFLKAARKKNKDTFRNWLEIKPTKEGGKVPVAVNDLIKEFDYVTNFKYKLYLAGVNSNIYGSGFIERTFFGGDSQSAKSEPSKNAKPRNLNILNSEFFKEMDYDETNKSDKTLYYIYIDNLNEKKLINPKRLITVSIDKMPHSPFGISKIHTLQKVLQSKMNTDESVGEILNWFSHGILTMQIQNMNDEQQEKMLKYFATHPDYYTYDQDYNLEIHNPTAIDPKPFFDYLYTNIANAFEMPVNILIGATTGQVTGTEIGVADYYHDVENIQQMIFTPIIEDTYKQLVESNGYKWKYKIEWNPIFVDELSEAKILEKKTLCATQNYNMGTVDLSEARRILNDGQIFLDVDKVVEKPNKTVPPPGSVPKVPNVEPVKPIEPVAESKWIPLTPVQKEMIKKLRELGEREILEQDKRIDEAKKKAKQ